MKMLPPGLWFFIFLAAGVPVLMQPFFPSAFWLTSLLLVALLGGTLFLTRRWPDRAFYLVCAGQPAIIAIGSTTIWAGLFVVWMLAGIAAGSMGLLQSRQDYYHLLLFFGLTLVLAAVIQVSNHVLFLVLSLGTGLALLAGIVVVRNYQFRKEYAGARQ